MPHQYSPYQPNIFDYLSQGDDRSNPKISREDWFINALLHGYGEICKRTGYQVTISERRAREAQKHWRDDLIRIQLEGGSTNPDHLKRAGYLTYWLRRRQVVDECVDIPNPPAVLFRDEFLENANEWLAFVFGFQLCLYFEIDKKDPANIDKQLGLYKLDPEYMKDVVLLMRHKNVSPHSIYIIFRSLFYPFRI